MKLLTFATDINLPHRVTNDKTNHSKKDGKKSEAIKISACKKKCRKKSISQNRSLSVTNAGFSAEVEKGNRCMVHYVAVALRKKNGQQGEPGGIIYFF